MQIQDITEACLFSSEIAVKLEAMDRLDQVLSLGLPVAQFKGEIRPTSDVMFPERPEWVMPRQLKGAP